MAALSNDKSTDLDVPNPSDINNVAQSQSMLSTGKKGRKLMIPLPPQHRSRITLTLQEAIDYELKSGRQLDPNMDMKHLRRTISNRLSAHRSRVKRSQYTENLEKMVKDLKDKISGLSQQIKLYKEKRKELLLENDFLRRRMDMRSSEVWLSEMLLEQRQIEICRLKELVQIMYSNWHAGEEEMHGLRFNQTVYQPYSLEFYQNGLLRFKANQLRQEQHSSSAHVQSEPEPEPEPEPDLKLDLEPEPEPEPEPDLELELEPLKVWAFEEEDIDQYLNFEDLFLDPPSF